MATAAALRPCGAAPMRHMGAPRRGPASLHAIPSLTRSPRASSWCSSADTQRFPRHSWFGVFPVCSRRGVFLSPPQDRRHAALPDEHRQRASVFPLLYCTAVAVASSVLHSAAGMQSTASCT
eukprot:277240-Chlamydomonas_euryale.AAC.4